MVLTTGYVFVDILLLGLWPEKDVFLAGDACGEPPIPSNN